MHPIHSVNLCKDVKRPQNHKCRVKSMLVVLREKRSFDTGVSFCLDRKHVHVLLHAPRWFVLSNVIIIREPETPGVIILVR